MSLTDSMERLEETAHKVVAILKQQRATIATLTEQRDGLRQQLKNIDALLDRFGKVVLGHIITRDGDVEYIVYTSNWKILGEGENLQEAIAAVEPALIDRDIVEEGK